MVGGAKEYYSLTQNRTCNVLDENKRIFKEASVH